MSMANFLLNNKIYEIQANNQISVVLSQFDIDYIISIVDDTLQKQLNTFDVSGPPNAVAACETMFKELYDTYPNEHDNIDDTRTDVYQTIIERICKCFSLQYNPIEGTNVYTMAYYLYDFFVSRFNNYLVTFFDRYLHAEKHNIYMNFHLEDMRKNKDMSTVYSKMYFNDDEEIGIIVANLPFVLKNLKDMAVQDYYIYSTIYGEQNQNVINLFLNNITPASSIYSIYRTILFNEILYPVIVTHIRLAIQLSSGNPNPIQPQSTQPAGDNA